MNFRGRENPESDQEEGVVDYTNQRYDNTVRISNGFNIEQLTEGVIFNPEELQPANNDEAVRSYDPNDLVHLLERRELMEEDENQKNAETTTYWMQSLCSLESDIDKTAPVGYETPQDYDDSTTMRPS